MPLKFCYLAIATDTTSLKLYPYCFPLFCLIKRHIPSAFWDPESTLKHNGKYLFTDWREIPESKFLTFPRTLIHHFPPLLVALTSASFTVIYILNLFSPDSVVGSSTCYSIHPPTHSLNISQMLERHKGKKNATRSWRTCERLLQEIKRSAMADTAMWLSNWGPPNPTPWFSVPMGSVPLTHNIMTNSHPFQGMQVAGKTQQIYSVPCRAHKLIQRHNNKQ